MSEEQKESSASMTMEASLPGGLKGRMSFRDKLSAQEWLLFILMIMQGLMIYLLVNQEGDRERRYSGTNAAILQLVQQNEKVIKGHDEILSAQKANSVEQRIQTYVLTRDEAQRKALNMQMPDELRDRLNRGYDDRRPR